MTVPLRSLTALLLALMLPLLLAGCGEEPDPSTAQEEPSAPSDVPGFLATEDGEGLVGCWGGTGGRRASP